MPLIPALGRQRQVDLCEFQDNLSYTENSIMKKVIIITTTTTKKQKVVWGYRKKPQWLRALMIL